MARIKTDFFFTANNGLLDSSQSSVEADENGPLLSRSAASHLDETLNLDVGNRMRQDAPAPAFNGQRHSRPCYSQRGNSLTCVGPLRENRNINNQQHLDRNNNASGTSRANVREPYPANRGAQGDPRIPGSVSTFEMWSF